MIYPQPMRIAPGFIRVISSPNTYTPSLLQQASGSPQDEGYFPIIIRVIFKFVLIREIRGPYPPEQRTVLRMVLPALVADHPERLHVACLQDAAELCPVAGGLPVPVEKVLSKQKNIFYFAYSPRFK
jgi:hypothetical protein